MDEKAKYKTFIGGLITIIFIILCLLYIVYISFLFFSRKDIDLIYSNKNIDSMPLILLNNSNFSLAFSPRYLDPLLENELHALDFTQKYFTYSINLRIISEKNNIINNYFEIKNCTKEDFYNKIDETFEINGINSMFCPKIDSSHNFTLEGIYTDNYYKYLIIEMKLTEYAKQHMDELKNEMIKKPMQLIAYYIDTSIDYENLNNPLKIKVSSSHTYLDFYFMKNIDIYISNLEFNKDDNIFIYNPKTYIKPIFDKNEENFRYFPDRTKNKSEKTNIKIRVNEESTSFNKTGSSMNVEENDSVEEDIDFDVLGRIKIKASQKLIQVRRKYKKFPSFIADLISLPVLLFIILVFLNNIYTKTAIKNELIKRMLKYDGSDRYDIEYLKNTFSRQADDSKEGESKISASTGSGPNAKIIDAPSQKKMFLEKKMIESNALKRIRNRFTEQNENVISQNITCTSLNTEDTNNNKKEEKKNNIYLNYSKLTICSILKIKYCSCRSKKGKMKKEIVEKAEKRINSYLDVYKYIQKMQEIDIMKKCLFDNEQKIILDFISKPSLKMNIDEKELYQKCKEDIITDRKYNKQEIDKLNNSYNIMLNKNDKSKKNRNLLKLFEQDINFFN